MTETTLRELLEAGVHFGHQTSRWNPRMRRYIFMERNGIYILDLQKTKSLLERAQKVVRDAVAAGGSVMFVGTKKQAQDTIRECAEDCGQFYVTERWLGGMLTNFQTIRQSLSRFIELERRQTDGTWELIGKKERLRLEKELGKLDRVFHGIKSMERPPSVMFVVDTNKEKIAVSEARKLGIPVIGVVDTNSDPELISHPIPANDDAIRSIQLMAGAIAAAVKEGAARNRDSRAEAEKAKADEAEAKAMAEKAKTPAPAASE
ncbi:30S ribosomal protein S2 [bacterium]|nr:30S ribosomal protein S2 [bacterium]